MSISSKNGDEGFTSLKSGEQVSKDDLRVNAYGNLDELAVLVSDALHYQAQAEIKPVLIQTRELLFRMIRELAAADGSYTNKITDSDAKTVTGIVQLYETRFKLSGLVVPGSTPASAKLDYCRVVCRRAERSIVALHSRDRVPVDILALINRLSDLFYILARFDEFKENKIEYKKR